MDEMKQPHTDATAQIDVSTVKHCLQKGDAKLALQYCHELLAEDPQHIQALSFAALASRSLGWLDNALDFINRAVAVAPSQPAIHSLMGDILLLQKRPADALTELLKAQHLGDGSEQLYFNIGSAYLALASYENAKNHFDQAREQLSRRPGVLPQLRIHRTPDSIDGFRFDDFEISGYDAQPHIAAPIAV